MNQKACKACWIATGLEDWWEDNVHNWEVSEIYYCCKANDQVGGWRQLKHGPPEDCPYLLEHLISRYGLEYISRGKPC